MPNVRVGTLSTAMMRRSLRLLDMEYKPAEIADELGVTKEQVIRLISAGAPARRDGGGHYWIHGETFVKWCKDAAPKNAKEKHTFEDNEAWCMFCKGVVTYKETRRKQHISFGLCPEGHKVSRFVSMKKNNEGKKQ